MEIFCLFAMEIESEDDKKYNALCTYYLDFVDVSQPVIYLIYKGPFLGYTYNKEKALTYVNYAISLYLDETFTEVETPPKDTNETVIFEAAFERGGEKIGIKVVEVLALKDMRQRETTTPRTMYFYALQLDKNTIHRGYTPFFEDAVAVKDKAVNSIIGTNKHFWTLTFPRCNKQCKLKVIDKLRRKILTSYAHLEGEHTKECPVFEFFRVMKLLHY